VSWDGKERRGMSTEDHDMLIRIETKLTKGLAELMDLNSRVRVLESGYWKVVGGVSFVVVAGDFIIKWMFK